MKAAGGQLPAEETLPDTHARCDPHNCAAWPQEAGNTSAEHPGASVAVDAIGKQNRVELFLDAAVTASAVSNVRPRVRCAWRKVSPIHPPDSDPAGEAVVELEVEAAGRKNFIDTVAGSDASGPTNSPKHHGWKCNRPRSKLQHICAMTACSHVIKRVEW